MEGKFISIKLADTSSVGVASILAESMGDAVQEVVNIAEELKEELKSMVATSTVYKKTEVLKKFLYANAILRVKYKMCKEFSESLFDENVFEDAEKKIEGALLVRDTVKSSLEETEKTIGIMKMILDTISEVTEVIDTEENNGLSDLLDKYGINLN